MEVPQPLQQLCNILKAIGKNKFFQQLSLSEFSVLL
jgi:hypothetical protein